MRNVTDTARNLKSVPPSASPPPSPSHVLRHKATASPAIGNRTAAVPPLKLGEKAALSSPLSPPSPLKAVSPRKLGRAISEKASSVKERVESAVSPRAKVARMLDGVIWLDEDVQPSSSSTSATPASPATPAPQLRKRKAEDGGERGDEKRVRFQLPVQTPPVNRQDAKSTTVTTPGGTAGNAGSHRQQIDELIEALGVPYFAPPRQNSFVERTPPGESPFTPSSLRKHGDRHEAEPTVEKPAPHQASTASGGDFTFAPDTLGRWAARQRAKGNAWVGKASGESFAATLQRALDRLQAVNGDRIDPAACGYLQEMFGLLPAGVRQPGKAFNYMLAKTFYTLGLTNAQWSAIEQLHKDFDRLDTRSDPQGCATLKAQLGEIIAAKKGLVYLKQQKREQALNEADS